MTIQTIELSPAKPSEGWLKRYYFTRFAFSAAWVALAATTAENEPQLAAVLLISYPTWDAIANLVDALQNGGIRRNKTQLLNFVVSIITTIAVIIALQGSMNRVIVIFGIWAGFSGILQLATAVRRWKSSGAQWAMIMSGAQSALASFYMVRIASGSDPVGIATIAPYAAFGAFYFLVSAIWLAVSDARKA